MQSSFFRRVISITAEHHSLAHVSPLPRAVGAEPGPATSHGTGTWCWCGAGTVAHLKKQHTPISDICSAHLHLSRRGRGMTSGDALNNLLTGVFRGELEGRGWLMASLSLTSQPPSSDALGRCDAMQNQLPSTAGTEPSSWPRMGWKEEGWDGEVVAVESRGHFRDLWMYLQACKGLTKTCLQMLGICQQTEVAYPLRMKKKKDHKSHRRHGQKLTKSTNRIS